MLMGAMNWVWVSMKRADVSWYTSARGCDKAPDDCIPVETTRLDLMMQNEQLVDARVNVMLIDVEGFDFEVLQGGNSTLHNTEYVEFEFNWRGQVRS
ncbi:MAG: hypothetical protein AN484_27005 [Aphanizomenon flos-aquae WA102]|uniref:Methyltransferase FkbM domain-containing protein n=1 Tax=Aphanizomenon flos-aquae WA102 TaxID=1710896 RepID=A0A1B7W9R3_APHFL|nr:MAG: hypothetical protein AN484_27005 [Aphanizomenon flos-aquae WA102]